MTSAGRPIVVVPGATREDVRREVAWLAGVEPHRLGFFLDLREPGDVGLDSPAFTFSTTPTGALASDGERARAARELRHLVYVFERSHAFSGA